MIFEQFKGVSPHILKDEPMSRHTTFKIGGNADMFVSVKSEDEILKLIKLAKSADVPYTIIGNGSNMLVGDKGIRGLVIAIDKDFAECRVEGDRIYAKAGILISKLASVALKNALTGFEEVSGIPGTLGGGIFMNAGAYGGEMKNIVESVTYIDTDGEIKKASNSECEFGYRQSLFSKGGRIILSAVLKLEKGNESEIRGKMDEYTKRRKEKQPLAYPSAGSTFKRPEGYFAGCLIENAGLKGYTVGGAQVSELHAGFVINKGNATASDVLAVIDHVKKVIKEKDGVDLEPEVRLIGEN